MSCPWRIQAWLLSSVNLRRSFIPVRFMNNNFAWKGEKTLVMTWLSSRAENPRSHSSCWLPVVLVWVSVFMEHKCRTHVWYPAGFLLHIAACSSWHAARSDGVCHDSVYYFYLGVWSYSDLISTSFQKHSWGALPDFPYLCISTSCASSEWQDKGRDILLKHSDIFQNHFHRSKFMKCVMSWAVSFGWSWNKKRFLIEISLRS